MNQKNKSQSAKQFRDETFEPPHHHLNSLLAIPIKPCFLPSYTIRKSSLPVIEIKSNTHRLRSKILKFEFLTIAGKIRILTPMGEEVNISLWELVKVTKDVILILILKCELSRKKNSCRVSCSLINCVCEYFVVVLFVFVHFILHYMLHTF